MLHEGEVPIMIEPENVSEENRKSYEEKKPTPEPRRDLLSTICVLRLRLNRPIRVTRAVLEGRDGN